MHKCIVFLNCNDKYLFKKIWADSDYMLKKNFFDCWYLYRFCREKISSIVDYTNTISYVDVHDFFLLLHVYAYKPKTERLMNYSTFAKKNLLTVKYWIMKLFANEIKEQKLCSLINQMIQQYTTWRYILISFYLKIIYP